MSFIQNFPQALPTTEAVYPPYYMQSPTGEMFYVWPAFLKNTDIPSESSECMSSSGLSSPPAAASMSTVSSPPHPVRNIKRRLTANRKERKRTISINSSFLALRNCLPYVPPDTKLSKIKTLRLATSYIAYLMDLLAQDDSRIKSSSSPDQTQEPSEDEKRKTVIGNLVSNCGAGTGPSTGSGSKPRARTGWPQQMWALELKHENSSSDCFDCSFHPCAKYSCTEQV